MSADRSSGEDASSANDDRPSPTGEDDTGDGSIDGDSRVSAGTPTPPAELDSRRRLGADEPAVEAVLEEVFALRRCDPMDLPPLFEAVDPDLLDGVWERGSADRTTWLTFTYAGCLVTLTGSGYLNFRLMDDAVEELVARADE